MFESMLNKSLTAPRHPLASVYRVWHQPFPPHACEPLLSFIQPTALHHVLLNQTSYSSQRFIFSSLYLSQGPRKNGLYSFPNCRAQIQHSALYFCHRCWGDLWHPVCEMWRQTVTRTFRERIWDSQKALRGSWHCFQKGKLNGVNLWHRQTRFAHTKKNIYI